MRLYDDTENSSSIHGKKTYVVYRKNMSSVVRELGAKKEGLTRFVKPESPMYNNGDLAVLFPFSYVNQV